MADKIDAEIERVRDLLLQAIEKNRFSLRELERQAGITPGLFRKPLRGDMRLTYRHVLEIVEAIGLPWTTFFRAAYPLPGEIPPSLVLGAENPASAVSASAPAAAGEPRRSELEDPEGQRFIAMLCRELIRLSGLDPRMLVEENLRAQPKST